VTGAAATMLREPSPGDIREKIAETEQRAASLEGDRARVALAVERNEPGAAERLGQIEAAIAEEGGRRARLVGALSVLEAEQRAAAERHETKLWERRARDVQAELDAIGADWRSTISLADEVVRRLLEAKARTQRLVATAPETGAQAVLNEFVARALAAIGSKFPMGMLPTRGDPNRPCPTRQLTADLEAEFRRAGIIRSSSAARLPKLDPVDQQGDRPTCPLASSPPL
jgi:hypothetical protein